MNVIIEKASEVSATPKTGIVTSGVGFASWFANVWDWLGPNLGTIVLLVSLVGMVVSIWNQIDQIRHRNKE